MERSDNELVEATLAGDRQAFDELVGRYGTKLYNMALRITGNAEDALDVAQTAFLNAYDKLRQFDSSYRFFSWLYRIGLNEALNVIHQRRRLSSSDVIWSPTASDPENKYASREIQRAVQAALLELAPPHRVVVVLRHFQGLSYQEMSEVIGVPLKTVKSRLFTARQLLRQLLRDRDLIP